jgi:hypothetical protein
MVTQKSVIYLIYILGLAGLIGLGLSFFNQLACEGQLVNVNLNPAEQQQIWGDQFIGQSFVAPHNHLNRLDLLLQTYRRNNTQDVTLRLLEIPAGLANLQQGSELFSTTFNAASVGDKQWRTFTFPEIPNSAGKVYLFNLQSPASTPGNAITIGGIDKDIYPPGSTFLGAMPLPADITFRACFQMTPLEKLRVLADQLTRFRPAWWGTSMFYLICGGIYMLLLIVFFWQLTRYSGQKA